MARLGVDLAWSEPNPLGVALLSDKGKLIAVAPSCALFLVLTEDNKVDWSARAKPDGKFSEVPLIYKDEK
jgi:hypothetical protein